MITQRAILVGILGFCLYLIAFVNVLPSFYVLTWLSVGILFSSLGIALLSLVGLSCTWRVAHARVSESLEVAPTTSSESIESDSSRERGPEQVGQDASLNGPLLELQLANSGTLNKINVIVEVGLECATRDEILTRRFLLEALPSGSSLAATLPLNHLPRGRYGVQHVRLIGSDVLGLFRIQKRVTVEKILSRNKLESRKRDANQRADNASPLTDETDNGFFESTLSGTTWGNEPELVVGPAMVALPGRGFAAGAGELVGTTGMTRMLGQSDELRGTRPYAAGDDLRRVHWRSTARHGELIVKEFHHAAQTQSVIIWDGQAGTNQGEGNVTSTEYGLRLVASVCRALSEVGRPYVLLRLDSSPLLVSSTDRSQVAGASLSRVIDALADADAERQEPLTVALNPFFSGLQPANEIFLITASTASDVLQVAQHWQTQGVRVVVGLVDGTAFNGIKSDRPGNRNANSRMRGATNGTLEASSRQQLLLQENGIQVALLSPTPEELARDPVTPLHNTLQRLLERQVSIARAHAGMRG